MQNSMLPFANANMYESELALSTGWGPKHTSEPVRKPKIRHSFRSIARCLNRLNDVTLLQTPPYSPEINPTKPLWAHVKRELKGYRFSALVGNTAPLGSVSKKISEKLA